MKVQRKARPDDVAARELILKVSDRIDNNPKHNKDFGCDVYKDEKGNYKISVLDLKDTVFCWGNLRPSVLDFAARTDRKDPSIVKLFIKDKATNNFKPLFNVKGDMSAEQEKTLAELLKVELKTKVLFVIPVRPTSYRFQADQRNSLA